ncbi:PLK3 [Cordylochernes scorpioides]|uniref:PLK3 n=1 Tax=Cordylochernes scorpioides TaxID=51811 RepID=A0ABY6L4K9_9ARAC|nr:PLK3 [Cordylochernes scorpioides]
MVIVAVFKTEKLTSFDADALYSQVEGIITNETTGQSFEKGNLLGKGGNGCCFKVRDIESNETLACKASWKCKYSLNEAKMLKSLDHPNIVKCFQHFCDKKFQYIIMERCDSSLLDICLEKEKDVNSIQNYVRQIAKACHYLHTKKHIIHGDLKPENILLKNGVVKLADFEIIMKQLCGVEIDCWALGCTIFQLFKGKTVFNCNDLEEINHIFINNKFKVPLTSCSKANMLIRGLLKTNPQRRYSMKDVLKSTFVKQPVIHAPLNKRVQAARNRRKKFLNL